MHFTVVAEFEETLPVEQVVRALAATQARHPLLQAHIVDHSSKGLAFHRPAVRTAIPLRILKQHVDSWRAVAAEELSRRFDPSHAPLARAVLIHDNTSSAILLTFYHCITDGIGAMAVLEDVVAALNHYDLQGLPLPPSQEEMIARTLRPRATVEVKRPASEDPRMGPGVPRPFDNTTPYVSTAAFDPDLTERLIQRCRSEETTVHGALLASVSRARSSLTGDEFVRALTPINFRDHIEVQGQCVDYHAAARTGSTPLAEGSFWDQARAASDALQDPRSASNIAAASAAVQQHIPPDVDAATALAVMATFGYDIAVSNLGVVEFQRVGAIHPTALWGPALLCQAEGEQVIGVTTFGGKLRMVACSYTPTDTLLSESQMIIESAVR